jgi:hypothetical protein
MFFSVFPWRRHVALARNATCLPYPTASVGSLKSGQECFWKRAIFPPTNISNSVQFTFLGVCHISRKRKGKADCKNYFKDVIVLFFLFLFLWLFDGISLYVCYNLCYKVFHRFCFQLLLLSATDILIWPGSKLYSNFLFLLTFL